METTGRIEVFFQGRNIQRLELKEVNESGCMVNLLITAGNGQESVSARGICSNEWLSISPDEFTLAFGQETSLTVRVTPDKWEHTGDYGGSIDFFENPGGRQLLSLDVIVHFKKLQSVPHSLTAAGVIGKSASDDHRSGETGSSGFYCQQCGAALPDKRPLCPACRKKQVKEEEDKLSISREKYRFTPRHLKMMPAGLNSGSDAHLWIGTAAALGILLIIMMCIAFKSASGGKYRGYGTLNISSEPSDALIFFEHDEFPVTQSPLHVSSFKAGKYRICLKEENSSTAQAWHDIEVKPNVENTYAFHLDVVGKLHIQSIPSSAHVFLDQIDTGRVTPLMLENIPEGRHVITIAGSPQEYAVTIKNGETASIFALLDSSKSGLLVKSIKGTDVYVDGKSIGRTPLDTHFLEPGRHRVTLKKSGCVPWQSEFEFSGGEVAELAVDPVSSGILVLDGGKGLSLYINGSLRGSIPQKIICNPGEKIAAKVISGDGGAWEKEFSLLPGEYRREYIALTAQKSVPVESSQHYSQGGNEFFDFNVGERFPPKDWKTLETLYEDVDYDGSDEMIIALKKLKGLKRKGEYPLHLTVVKKTGGQFRLISLQAPGREGIGLGEIYGLCVYKTDDLGYREIEYVCGDRAGKVTSSGAFIIYHGSIEKYSWVARTI